MRGWRRQYDHFAGPRYASLIGYAQLLTGDRHRADALVDFALRRTFGRLRRRSTDAQTEAELRRLIVARFIATAGHDDALSAQAPTSMPPEPTAAATQPAQSEVDPSIYAPPESRAHSETTSQTFELLHAPVTHATDETPGDSRAPHEPHQSRPRAETEKSRQIQTQTQSEPFPVGTALAMLEPTARAMVVLRHLDGLAPSLIAAQLGVTPDQVATELREAYTVLRAQLGITIPDEPDQIAHSTRDGANYVTVKSHGGGPLT